MVDMVGEVAGRIWDYLDQYGEVTILRLKSYLKVSNTLICMAIGWLAREHKVIIQKQKREYTISLK
ncbi:winged helix-turn-helix domain-containing protein [bacterium]|nr:winged helix-turn-helix domain-containing protein [bacterium]